MNCPRNHALLALMSLLLLALFSIPTSPIAAVSTVTSDSARGIRFAKPPLRFEINEGQTDPQVRFTARDRNGVTFLTSGGAVLQVARVLPKADKPIKLNAVYEPNARGFESSFVTLKTVGANSNPQITGLERLPGVTNYLISNDRTKWRTNIAGYARVKYEQIYPGIDLVYYGNKDGRLEYDFIVSPGADPGQIAVSVEGADLVRIDQKGDLIISTATGSIRQPAPRIYQEVGGKREEIAGRYRLMESKQGISDALVAFELEEYDESRALVIDPEVIYATYLGGSSNDPTLAEGATDVAVDATGAAYIVGSAVSADFPTRLPLQGTLKGESDAFITKLDAGGQLVYSTFLGGGGSDAATAIKLDETGAVYVGGSTGSPDFPRVNAVQTVIGGGGSDAFVAKLSATGSALDYSTYLGGRSFEVVDDLALDEANNLFILGSIILDAGSNDFPTVNPLQAIYGGGVRDGFWSVISSSGSSLLYSTYLGGNGNDRLQTINVDPSSGNVYLSYSTDSSNFPASSSSAITPAAEGEPRKGMLGFEERGLGDLIGFIVIEDIHIRHLSPSYDEDGVAVIGGQDFLEGYFLDADIQPNSLNRSAITSAQKVAPQSGGGLDARITLFDEDLNITNTLFFGGSREETINSLAIDNRRAIYIVGNTTSTDLPTVNPIQANHGGGFSRDGFLAVFHPQTLEPVFATYLGGSGIPEEVRSVTVDEQGNIYVVGITFSTDFPTATPGAVQNQLSGRSDAFIIKISPVEIATEPDFAISTSPVTLTLRRGAKAKVSINVARIAGFDGNVTITGPNTKSIKTTVKPKQHSTRGNEVSFTVKVKPAGVIGEHNIVYSATDNSGRTRTATLKLIIE